MTPRILVVDDDADMREACADALQLLGAVDVVCEADAQSALGRLAEGYDLMISDLRMPGMDGRELIRAALEQDPNLPVLMLTGYPTVQTAVDCLKLGAADYITKPILPADLVASVRRCLKLRRLEDENALLRRQVARSFAAHDLIGRSPAMQEVLDVVDRVASTDVDVLIQGETGTGKELVARALHDRSRRNGKPFVPVDCGAIPENLLESEFFGYERGAFTGAEARNIGLLEYAHGGTLFLDELGQLPLALQAKLLRALQERKIRRLGGKTEIDIDVRVVAATAVDLHRATEDGRFRQDLYFRINVVTIHLPPLRERGDDVEILARHFLARHAAEQAKEVVAFTDQSMGALRRYDWPGNVRELQNVVRRGIAMTRGREIDIADLPRQVLERTSPGSPRAKLNFFELRAQRLAAFERQFLRDVLEANNGDVTAAARAAEIPRATFYRLLKNHDIRPAEFRGSLAN